MEKSTKQKDLFFPIESKTIVDQVIKIISGLIKDKKLKPGDRIMNEYELAKNLVVGRSTVREAFKILNAFNVVEIKPGDGTYISKGTKISPLEVLGYCLLLDESSPNLIFQLRAMLEIGLMNILIGKITKEEFEILEEHIKKQEKIGKEKPFDEVEYTKLDIDFHIKLVLLTRNPLIERLYRTMLDIFSSSIERSVVYQKGHETSTAMHRYFIDVLKKGDKEKINDVVIKSLDIWKEVI